MANELEQILKHIEDNHNFLLSGGAGSGKTYSLVEVIHNVIEKYPKTKIACITYTNVAVKEIDERVNHKSLKVSTIHDFLWDSIKGFQKEIKDTLIELINDEKIAKYKFVLPISSDYFNNTEKIEYREYLKLDNGYISHNEVILLSAKMYEKYKMLCSILKDKYRFIFVDEYQDTQKEVVDILLNHISQSAKISTIGFFGDSMQSIYDEGIGNLQEYISDSKVYEVQKEQNRRNPRLIIELANKLRDDRLVQKASDDTTAPNMQDGKLKDGNIKFIYSKNKSVDEIKKYLNWDFDNSKTTKELNLTHNLIAKQFGFEELLNIYDNDKIIDYIKRVKEYIKTESINTDFSNNTFQEVIDILSEGKSGKDLAKIEPTKGMREFIDSNQDIYNNILQTNYEKVSKIYLDKKMLLDNEQNDTLMKHLYKIANCIYLYKTNNINEFIKEVSININSIADKRELKNNIESLIIENKNIENVIKEANEKKIVFIDDKLDTFIKNNDYLYNKVKNIHFTIFQKFYEYIEEYTPFATQHSTKGAEFDNIFIFLDNGNWNKYNFEHFFKNSTAKEDIIRRTEKLFYVCCTRAKENLAMYYKGDISEFEDKIVELFGKDNIVNLDII